jgi:hypothetical protein
LKAVVLIIDALSENNCINNLQFTALDNQFSQKLLNLLRNYGTEQYNPQQVILIFIYVCIIFDAVFLEELVGSAFELMPQRANNKADQYSHLAGTSEKMRNVLIDMVIYQGYCLDRPDVEQLGIVDLMIDGIILMLAVCEKCRKHVEGEFVASEYVNRATFDAILNKLKGILSKTGINVPNYTPMELCCTRFTILYNGLKNLYTSFNPPKRPRTYQDGYNAAIKDAMTLLCVGKQSNN